MATFPSSHTTGTTVTSTTTADTTSIKFDPCYLRSVPGILKIVQVILCLVGFLCVELNYNSFNSARGWYGFVSMSAFWITLILIAFYIFHVIEKLQIVPWLLVELIYCSVWAVEFFIASVVVSYYSGKYAEMESWAAGAFFGFGAMMAFALDAFLKFRSWRNGEIAQGERTVTTTTAPKI